MDIDYLNNYEQKLTENLMRIIDQQLLLSSEDIDNVWKESAPEYMVDAVPNIAQYPLVSIAWAGFYGMAVAKLWDKDIRMLGMVDGISLYHRLRNARGFDEMDEYIMEGVLGYLPETNSTHEIDDMMHRLAQLGLDSIRHENVEPQTEMAFHVYARTLRAVFRSAAAWQLSRMKYNLTKL